jgi:hypothetical protein
MDRTTEYTMRTAIREDAERLLSFHNTHGVNQLYERSLRDLYEPINKDNLFLVERDSDKAICAMGGVFQISQTHQYFGACIDTMRSSGSDRAVPVMLEIAFLKNLLESPLDALTFYVEINADNPHLKMLEKYLNFAGYESIQPDNVMSEYSQRHDKNVPTVYFAVPNSSIDKVVRDVLERGDSYITKSRHFQERQVVKIDTPIVHQRERLTELALGRVEFPNIRFDADPFARKVSLSP